MEPGTWAEWAGAVASCVAAGLSGVALVLSARANHIANKALARDDERQRAAVARQLQAWWVTWPNEDATGSCYGVLIRNGGEAATVFYDVEVETRGNALADAGRAPALITSERLPPGDYIVRSMGRQAGDSGARPWSFIEPATDLSRYAPLLRAKKFTITAVRFTDPLGIRWEWTPAGSLRDVGSAI